MNIVYNYVDEQFCLYPYTKESFKGQHYNKTTVGFEVEMGYGSTPYVEELIRKLNKEAEAKSKGEEIENPVTEEQKIAYENYQLPENEVKTHLGYHGEFVQTFSKFINGEVKACMAFYAGDRNEIFKSNLNILNNINNIFKRERN